MFYTSAPQHGFFVTRQSPDVAFFHWVATAEEAEQIAAKLSVRENAHYDVIPARPIGSSSLKGSGFPRQPDWEAPIDQEPEYEEPDEGDWITSDHRNFYSYGKRVLEVDDDTATDHKRLWAAIDATMKRQNFYPNVWFISDHGNWHLMTRDR